MKQFNSTFKVPHSRAIRTREPNECSNRSVIRKSFDRHRIVHETLKLDRSKNDLGVKGEIQLGCSLLTRLIIISFTFPRLKIIIFKVK